MTTQITPDSSNVYYIHPSDASTTQLVSVKFSDINYNNWKRLMMLTLSTKNKLGFVNGTIMMPEVTSSDFNAWERFNALVTSWILFNLDETIARSVLFLKSARVMWKDLEDRFGCTSITELYSLEIQLAEVSQGSQSVSEFYTKIKTIWDSIDDISTFSVCACGKCTCDIGVKFQAKIQDQRLLQFLIKPNDKYSGVRAHIVMMQPLPSVSQAYRLVAQEENHKDLSQISNLTENMSFFADKRQFNSQRFNSNLQRQSSGGYNQPVFGSHNQSLGNSNHRPSNYTNVEAKKPQIPGANYLCTHCKVQGHIIDRCFKIHGCPPGFKGFKDKKALVSCAPTAFDVSENSHHSEFGGQISIDQYNNLLSLINK